MITVVLEQSSACRPCRPLCQSKLTELARCLGAPAELMLRRPWFQSQTAEGMRNAPTEIGTLGEMFAVLGTPTEADWPSMGDLPNCMRFSPCKGQPLRSLFPQAWSMLTCTCPSFSSVNGSNREGTT